MIKQAVVFTLSVFAASATFAQSTVDNAHITSIGTGWNADTFGIYTSEAMINPAGCASADLYSVDSTAPGYKLYYTASLIAFQNKQLVKIAVSNTECASNGRPKLIGVRVYGN